MGRKTNKEKNEKFSVSFYLDNEKRDLFFSLKGKLTEKLGKSVSNADVLKLLLEEAKKTIEKIKEN